MNAAAPDGWEQSLADGAPGIALMHIERARTGLASWNAVHRLAQLMVSAPIQANPAIACLFYGAPAVAYALHTAGQPAYGKALATLDGSISTSIRHRLDAAHRRIDAGLVARAGEYDLINGLTGLGAYLTHRGHDHELLRDVLGYLTRLTHPIEDAGEILPGWWAAGSPDRRQSPRWAGGHAGFGMAHGICGALALLSTAMRRGTTVNGQEDAIRVICGWLDQWRSGNGAQAWWPEVISRDQLRSGTASRGGPPRPSWCYGTPGIACAQHLAGLALGDPARARIAERALIGCLTDELQLCQLTDAGLCHGWVGLMHTTRRVHADSGTSELPAAAEAAARRPRQRPRDHGEHEMPADEGFLTGTAGITLACGIRRTVSPAGPRWDTCLLTS